ncbi:phosphotransferase enzyme family protein [Paenibacillus aestuarii]|uniref:Phosphotransferase enzyme family protein n=1 Tax=Paenibacillus aestuarii TaxID=516965 RepID=A0ABW0KJD7_9BACL|nr:phosphotransferase [Paenibacillus aestuarii]
MEQAVNTLFGMHILNEAADRFSLTKGSYKKLGDFENYVYEVEREGQSYVMRFTHSSHRSELDVLAELDWISYLVQVGVDIPQVYTSRLGKMTEVIHAGDSYFTASLFQKAEGHMPDYANPAEWNEHLFASWGEITGRMHKATQSYTPSIHHKRMTWEDDELLVNAKSYVLPGDEYVLERLNEVMTHLHSLPQGQDVYGLIHTDIHSRNFFVDNGRISVFDFDDCAYNWFIHDIAIPLYYALSWGVPERYAGNREAFAADFVQAFWSGYEKVMPLSRQWLQELSTFLKLRDITLYLVIHKKEDLQLATPRLIQWVNDIKERIRQNIAIVEIDFDLCRFDSSAG